MSIFHAFLLSLLQGVTEFLPVSSSGHLVLAEALLEGGVPRDRGIVFEVLVHVGTLVSIGIVFRARLIQLLHYGFVEAWRVSREQGAKAAWLTHPDGRLISSVFLATCATGVVGLSGKKYFEALFERPDRIGWALCITAVILASTWFVKNKTSSAADEEFSFPFWKTFLAGIAQGIAVAPGISRSGTTIAVALLLGMSRRSAGEFSFLIAIPAILGALVIEARDFNPETSALSLPAGVVGFVVAAASGYLFLRLLLRLVRGGQFSYFAPYCLAVGIWAICWF